MTFRCEKLNVLSPGTSDHSIWLKSRSKSQIKPFSHIISHITRDLIYSLLNVSYCLTLLALWSMKHWVILPPLISQAFMASRKNNIELLLAGPMGWTSTAPENFWRKMCSENRGRNNVSMSWIGFIVMNPHYISEIAAKVLTSSTWFSAVIFRNGHATLYQKIDHKKIIDLPISASQNLRSIYGVCRQNIGWLERKYLEREESFGKSEWNGQQLLVEFSCWISYKDFMKYILFRSNSQNEVDSDQQIGLHCP